VMRSDNAGSSFSQVGTDLASNAVSYQDTTAAEATPYLYKVIAFNGTGAGAASSTSATTTFAAAPDTLAVDAITTYVLSLEENPLKGDPKHLPLKLVGDGATPRYQDNEAGQVTLHSRESLASVGAALGDANLNELRFRHNIVIDGVAAWEEQSWAGGNLRVGNVVFETVVPKVRCLATHANPLTGERDLQVMQILVKAFAQSRPTFGVGMLSAVGGEIQIGDTVVPA